MPLHNRPSKPRSKPSKLRITHTTKSVGKKPTTRNDLISIIEQELERQGPDADLNFIDTSEIDDMSLLFRLFDVRNIKIDQLDVSNNVWYTLCVP